jgi:hypothetical protein
MSHPLRAPAPGVRRRSRSGKHEGEEEDEYALTRVHDDAHPHALPPPRGIGGKDDVSQRGGIDHGVCRW